MRKIITTTFASLDGVMQGRGGPEEDESGEGAERLLKRNHVEQMQAGQVQP